MILHVLIAMIAGWVQRHQQQVITYLQEENRVLKTQLGGRRLRLTDTERRRLAALAHPLGGKRLKDLATLATPDTLMRWYRRLIAHKFDGSPHRTQLGRPYRWCWWLRNAALSYERHRQLEGTVEADDLYHMAGQKGQAPHGSKKSLGRRARGRRKKREPGRGHYDKDRPAIIAWVNRQGGVVIHAPRDLTVKTVQKAADLAMQAGSKLYTDSASSYRLITGYAHDAVNHTQKEDARGDVHENRAESLFSLLKPCTIREEVSSE